MPPEDPNYHRKLLRFAAGVMVMVGIAMGAYYTVHSGYYPAAIIGSRVVTARTLNEAVGAVAHYYEQALKTYSVTDTSLKDKQISIPEVRRLTLDKMIENEFVSRELEATVGNDLTRLVAAKINTAELQDPEFGKAVATLYGLTRERFRIFVLEPQAREEILQNTKFEAKADEFKNWLTRTRKSASVVILVPDLAWDGEKVVLR